MLHHGIGHIINVETEQVHILFSDTQYGQDIMDAASEIHSQNAAQNHNAD
jgi:hypothetical protein